MGGRQAQFEQQIVAGTTADDLVSILASKFHLNPEHIQVQATIQNGQGQGGRGPSLDEYTSVVGATRGRHEKVTVLCTWDVEDPNPATASHKRSLNKPSTPSDDGIHIKDEVLENTVDDKNGDHVLMDDGTQDIPTLPSALPISQPVSTFQQNILLQKQRQAQYQQSFYQQQQAYPTTYYQNTQAYDIELAPGQIVQVKQNIKESNSSRQIRDRSHRPDSAPGQEGSSKVQQVACLQPYQYNAPITTGGNLGQSGQPYGQNVNAQIIRQSQQEGAEIYTQQDQHGRPTFPAQLLQEKRLEVDQTQADVAAPPAQDTGGDGQGGTQQVVPGASYHVAQQQTNSPDKTSKSNTLAAQNARVFPPQYLRQIQQNQQQNNVNHAQPVNISQSKPDLLGKGKAPIGSDAPSSSKLSSLPAERRQESFRRVLPLDIMNDPEAKSKKPSPSQTIDTDIKSVLARSLEEQLRKKNSVLKQLQPHPASLPVTAISVAGFTAQLNALAEQYRNTLGIPRTVKSQATKQQSADRQQPKRKENDTERDAVIFISDPDVPGSSKIGINPETIDVVAGQRKQRIPSGSKPREFVQKYSRDEQKAVARDPQRLKRSARPPIAPVQPVPVEELETNVIECRDGQIVENASDQNAVDIANGSDVVNNVKDTGSGQTSDEQITKRTAQILQQHYSLMKRLQPREQQRKEEIDEVRRKKAKGLQSKQNVSQVGKRKKSTHNNENDSFDFRPDSDDQGLGQADGQEKKWGAPRSQAEHQTLRNELGGKQLQIHDCLKRLQQGPKEGRPTKDQNNGRLQNHKELAYGNGARQSGLQTCQNENAQKADRHSQDSQQQDTAPDQGKLLNFGKTGNASDFGHDNLHSDPDVQRGRQPYLRTSKRYIKKGKLLRGQSPSTEVLGRDKQAKDNGNIQVPKPTQGKTVQSIDKNASNNAETSKQLNQQQGKQVGGTSQQGGQNLLKTRQQNVKHVQQRAGQDVQTEGQEGGHEPDGQERQVGPQELESGKNQQESQQPGKGQMTQSWLEEQKNEGLVGDLGRLGKSDSTLGDQVTKLHNSKLLQRMKLGKTDRTLDDGVAKLHNSKLLQRIKQPISITQPFVKKKRVRKPDSKLLNQKNSKPKQKSMGGVGNDGQGKSSSQEQYSKQQQETPEQQTKKSAQNRNAAGYFLRGRNDNISDNDEVQDDIADGQTRKEHQDAQQIRQANVSKRHVRKQQKRGIALTAQAADRQTPKQSIKEQATWQLREESSSSSGSMYRANLHTSRKRRQTQSAQTQPSVDKQSKDTTDATQGNFGRILRSLNTKMIVAEILEPQLTKSGKRKAFQRDSGVAQQAINPQGRKKTKAGPGTKTMQAQAINKSSSQGYQQNGQVQTRSKQKQLAVVEEQPGKVSIDRVPRRNRVLSRVSDSQYNKGQVWKRPRVGPKRLQKVEKQAGKESHGPAKKNNSVKSSLQQDDESEEFGTADSEDSSGSDNPDADGGSDTNNLESDSEEEQVQERQETQQGETQNYDRTRGFGKRLCVVQRLRTNTQLNKQGTMLSTEGHAGALCLEVCGQNDILVQRTLEEYSGMASDDILCSPEVQVQDTSIQLAQSEQAFQILGSGQVSIMECSGSPERSESYKVQSYREVELTPKIETQGF